MPVETGMYQTIQPLQLESPINQLAKFQQIQSLQNQNRMANMDFAERQRQANEAQEARNALVGAGGDIKEGINALSKRGLFGQAMALQKSQTDLEKERAAIAKQQLDSLSVANGIIGSAVSAVKQNPTFENASAVLQKLKHQFGPEMSAQLGLDNEVIPNNPKEILDWADKHYVTSIATEKQLADNRIRLEGALNRQSSEKIAAGHDKASMANAAAVRETANATRDAARMTGDRNAEMKLADDYRAQSKPFKEVADAYRTINATLDSATKSPAATLAAATKFMKLLDPGSVVRESELGMALAATGAFDRLTNYYNTLKQGKVLTASQVDDFRKTTAQIYQAAQQGQQSIDASYRSNAQKFGLRPEVILQDLGQNTKASSGTKLPAGWTVEVQ